MYAQDCDTLLQLLHPQCTRMQSMLEWLEKTLTLHTACLPSATYAVKTDTVHHGICGSV